MLVAELVDRIVMHVDFDYFFAQVEERENPAIRDKPVVVCVYSGRGEDRGTVSTANYIARKLGVKSGIPIAFAKEKLKNVEAVFLPVNHALYDAVSERIMDIISKYADSSNKWVLMKPFWMLLIEWAGALKKHESLQVNLRRKSPRRKKSPVPLV